MAKRKLLEFVLVAFGIVLVSACAHKRPGGGGGNGPCNARNENRRLGRLAENPRLRRCVTQRAPDLLQAIADDDNGITEQEVLADPRVRSCMNSPQSFLDDPNGNFNQQIIGPNAAGNFANIGDTGLFSSNDGNLQVTPSVVPADVDLEPAPAARALKPRSVIPAPNPVPSRSTHGAKIGS